MSNQISAFQPKVTCSHCGATPSILFYLQPPEDRYECIRCLKLHYSVLYARTYLWFLAHSSRKERYDRSMGY